MKNNSLPLVGIVAAAIVLGVAFFALRSGTEVEPAPPASPDVSAPEAPATSPPSTVSEVQATPEPAEPARTPVRVAAPSEPPYPQYDEPMLFRDDIEGLVEEHGFEAAYSMANEEHRMNMLDYLTEMDDVRGHLDAIMRAETSSDLRAYALENTVPVGLFDEPGEGEAVVDRELIGILKGAPDEDVGSGEWVRRMDLARLVDPGEALYWARQSEQRFPGDREVGIVAAEAVLAAQEAQGGVSGSETGRAESFIMDTLSGGDLRSIDSDYRLRAYTTLARTLDAARAREFFAQQLDRETDPRILRVLGRLAAGAE